jgi:acyl dehydratase
MDRSGADLLRGQVGQTFVSDWIAVDQALVDRFADATQDWNFIHVDPEKAAQTPLGGTIAHGFLLLSLLAPLRMQTARPAVPGLAMGLNYGFDRIRFIHPVRAGSRIRAHFHIAAVDETTPGQFREATDVELEIEGVHRIAVVARWLTLYVLEKPAIHHPD